MRILAVTVNWRQAEATLECAAAVAAMAGPPTDLLIVDNGSGDGSTARLRAALPDAVIIDRPDNDGFAVGANTGLRHALAHGYDYALLLNNDAFPAVDMLDQLLAEAASDIALLAPLVLFEAEPDRIWFGGGSQHPTLLELHGRARGERVGPAWTAARDVDYLLGTAVLINLAAARAVGLYDERYFMYYEDLDWSLRLRDAGYRLRLVGAARIFHRVAISSGGEDAPWRRFHLARSSVLFFRRHAHRGRPALILLNRAASAFKTTLRLLLTGHGRAAAAHLRGLADGLRLPADPTS